MSQDRRSAALLIAGAVLISANLRAALTSVGPLLDRIRSGAGLSGPVAGLLNTLPLLAFAAFSPLAPRLSRRLGRDRVLLAALLVLAVGTVLRSVPGVAPLFAGTVVLGAAIAVGNVVLPDLIRHHFPDRISVLTGLYTTTMGLVASLASGVAVPLADAAPGGWRTALGCWAVLAVVGAALWSPRAVRAERPATAARPVAVGMPWRSPLAWQVTGFMGLQSLGFYVMIAWLPSILRSHGTSSAAAGWLLFGYQFIALAAGLSVPLAMRRVTDHRGQAAAAAGCSFLGYLGLGLAPGAALLWIALMGIGGGACLVIALSFIGLRAAEPAHTAALSGMVQSIGYLLAALGPVLIGVLHDGTGSWTLPLLVLAGTAALLVAVGLFAGRPLRVTPSRSADARPDAGRTPPSTPGRSTAGPARP